MDFTTLIKAAGKPEIYTPGTSAMWVDEYISIRLLETHLSQETDLASRKESTISSTVQWIMEKVPGDKLKILDLGCGPGFYAEKMAERGHIVTGMDISANSIEYARESARANELDITYLLQDYLELEEEGCYDLILLIFTDFGVLVPEQRTTLLRNIYRALKPGGFFIFDVLNDNYKPKGGEAQQWEVSTSGFWRDKPYLALTASFHYAEQKVTLSQHIIVEEDGGMEVYRFWIHTCSNEDLERILSTEGFNAIQCYEKVIPDSELYGAGEVTFCIAGK